MDFEKFYSLFCQKLGKTSSEYHQVRRHLEQLYNQLNPEILNEENIELVIQAYREGIFVGKEIGFTKTLDALLEGIKKGIQKQKEINQNE